MSLASARSAGRVGWWVLVAAVGLQAAAWGGCAVWPRITSAKGTAHVVFETEAATQAAEVSLARRLVVVTYWRTPPINENPASYEFAGAFAVQRAEFEVSLGAQMYAVVSTPELGVQHLAPEAGIIVFAEGYWPGYATGWCGGKARPRSEPPVQKGLAFDVTLLPDTQTPSQERSADVMVQSMFPPLADQLDVLWWYLATGRGITDADRLMVYRQLAKHVRTWQGIRPRGEPQTTPGRVAGALAELDRLIGELEHSGGAE